MLSPLEADKRGIKQSHLLFGGEKEHLLEMVCNSLHCRKLTPSLPLPKLCLTQDFGQCRVCWRLVVNNQCFSLKFWESNLQTRTLFYLPSQDESWVKIKRCDQKHTKRIRKYLETKRNVRLLCPNMQDSLISICWSGMWVFLERLLKLYQCLTAAKMFTNYEWWQYLR